MFRVFKDEYKTQNWNKHQKLHRVCERKMEHFYKKWKKNKYVCPIVYLRQYFKQSFSLELFFFLFGIAPKRNKKVQRLIFFIQFLKAFIQFLIIFYCLHELASLRFICFSRFFGTGYELASLRFLSPLLKVDNVGDLRRKLWSFRHYQRLSARFIFKKK